MRTNPNDPIGVVIPQVDETGRIAVGFPDFEYGLTKREYIATQVLAGLAALPTSGASNHMDRAEKAVRMADALIVALNRPDADVEI